MSEETECLLVNISLAHYVQFLFLSGKNHNLNFSEGIIILLFTFLSLKEKKKKFCLPALFGIKNKL